MDKIVFDVETKNTFADIGGEANMHKFEISVAAAYSYDKDEYYCFEERELDELGEMMRKAGLIIGFSSKRFDVPILNNYFKFNLGAVPHYDILEQIENKWGRRISLDLLSEANLGIRKTGHGLEAIEWYKNGEMEKLKEYCKQDVKITKQIFDLIKAQKYLWIPQRNNPEMAKVELKYEEKEPDPQGALL
ncbi:hypothetical protein A3I34_02725 [Candidatus Jorgensenbacteria bacterium RIFCSPLOWO2_02_FULL_45_12]|uniref:YprB ribonuclease H-like domain-containing protein n=2 Tax=Candidatus Joergenseniibacteriota TaxID=1752739 RepID=A0A1F6BQY0_9BACT|nr:MAG: DEAD/DEAH box helicase domain protein [Candidatus Jorgensenbacteria bacterium GW2011_GWA2_45_9]OGG39258.1 MAG: hypothetical protein A3D55_02555 [Candidatus Jorgensenbacteria bacterium RIFCSPHIGHO2_02_FULL_45_20]OGG42792.1 MAG: hypothetical protein A3I34_02725 [Candidatus Jorgensenbacteria bacterium RIFCSPLOWO2_02_FULL_45_12]